MRCTRSRGSRGFHCLVCLPRPGERGRYPARLNSRLLLTFRLMRRFTLKAMLLAFALCCLSLAYCVSIRSGYISEQLLMTRLREKCPDLHFTTHVTGPRWRRELFSAIVGHNYWVHRITTIDISGDLSRNGNLPPSQVPFSDADLSEFVGDFVQLPFLSQLCLSRTRLTDESLPAITRLSDARARHRDARNNNDGLIITLGGTDISQLGIQKLNSYSEHLLVHTVYRRRSVAD